VHKFDLFEPGQFPSVIVEHDTQSVIERIDARQVKLLAVLATIMTFAIAASLIMSNWLTKPVRELSIQSRELVENVVSGTFDQIRFPNSQIREYNELSLGLQEAAERLTESFNELLAMKTTLEERVRERTKALERLSMVASQTTNGVLITDPEGRVQWINEGFTRLSGYAEDDIIGHKPGAVLQGPDTDQATVKQIRKALNDNQEFYAEILNYTKSGVPYWVEISCNPMKNADGEIEGFIAIESNITDRKHADLSKDEFISTVSHELRTPLTSIKGGLGLVMGGALGTVPEKATDVLTIADRNAERLIY
ncbi:MAG: PAS domain-containing protein, partial [Rickettsiales bacterium]